MAVLATVELLGYEPYVHLYPDATTLTEVKVDALADFGEDPNESYRFRLSLLGVHLDETVTLISLGLGPFVFVLVELYEPGHG